MTKHSITSPFCTEIENASPLPHNANSSILSWKAQAIVSKCWVRQGGGDTSGEGSKRGLTCSFATFPNNSPPPHAHTLRPPRTAMDHSPQEEIGTSSTSNQRSRPAGLHPKAVKNLDRYGPGPGSSLNGSNFTSPSLCCYFPTPFFTLGNARGQP